LYYYFVNIYFCLFVTVVFQGLQTEDLPYLYYTPGYGYTYPSPDQYAVYQQYMAGPSYQSQNQVSPSAYVPVVIQPGSDFSSYASLVAFNPSAVSTDVTGIGSGLTSSPLVNNTSAKGRPHTSTSGTISPVSLVTGASRSSNQNQVANKPLVGSIVSNGNTRDNLV
jgi:YTH domain-containing family protein